MNPYRCYNCRQEVEVGAVDAEGGNRCPHCDVTLNLPTAFAEAYDQPTIDMPVRSPLARIDTAAGRLLALGSLLVLTLVVSMIGNAVSIAFCVFIVLGAINGYIVGASTVTATFVGILVAAGAAIPLGRYAEPAANWLLGTTGLTNRLLSTAMMAAIVMALVAVVTRTVLDRVMRRRHTWKLHNRLLGAGLGLCEGAVVTLALIWAVISLDPVKASSPLVYVDGKPIAYTSRDKTPPPPSGKSNQPSAAEQTVTAIAATARESTVGKVAQQVTVGNPLEQLRIFVLSQKTLQVLSDPIAREDFLRYPVIRRVQQYTSVQDALTILRSDDELMRILESESPITQEQIRAILDSQTMLDALDQTSVIEDLRPDLVAIERALEFALSDYMPLDPDADSSAPDTSPDNSDSDDDDSPSTKGPPAIAEQINFDGE